MLQVREQQEQLVQQEQPAQQVAQDQQVPQVLGLLEQQVQQGNKVRQDHLEDLLDRQAQRVPLVLQGLRERLEQPEQLVLVLLALLVQLVEQVLPELLERQVQRVPQVLVLLVLLAQLVEQVRLDQLEQQEQQVLSQELEVTSLLGLKEH